MTPSKERVFVALSGGVDSSVAAALLKERGFDVVGIHMKMWNPADSYQLSAASYQQDTVCRQQRQDRIDAMRAAAALDIPFQTWDFSEEYRRAVVEYMIREYAAGRTPNPDVMCNREIKFGLFLRRALQAGADYVATGHYVRTHEGARCKVQGVMATGPRDLHLTPNTYHLITAKDQNKDQSYFLWTLTPDKLRHCLFPIGEYTKPEVRALARKFNLPTAEKPDSQGICFIGEIDVREFLKRYIPERRGRVLTTAGRVIGEHDGVEFYTIGQRHGLGIGGALSAPQSHAQRGGAPSAPHGRTQHDGGIPYYVTEKDPDSNTLTVAEGPYDAGLFRSELAATGVNWISRIEPRFPLHCEARIRYRQPVQPCRVERIKNHESRIRGQTWRTCNSMIQDSNTMIHVAFDSPQRAVTPGQSVVFYRRRELLGGGIIR